MSRLVDPRVCPDCRAPLDHAATCTGCGLRLVGPLAAELSERMHQADRLVEQLRAAMPTATPTSAPPATVPAGPGMATPAAVVPSARRRLPSASVPVILLTLGGLCLLVAAVVFAVVAWGSLGLAAKTLILLAVTGLFTWGAVVLTRRGLRFGAETVWLVVAGMVGLDLAAAYGADLVGLADLDLRHMVAVIGAALLGLSVSAGAWAASTPLRRLKGLIVVAGVGVVLLAGAEAWTRGEDPLAVTVSIPLLVLLAVGIGRIAGGVLRETALVVGGAGAVSWLALVGIGVGRMALTESDGQWWTDLEGWPLLAAAAMATVLTVPRQLLRWTRMAGSAGALVTLALLAVGPSTGPTADLLAWSGVAGVIAVVSALAPVIWARPAAALAALSLLVAAVATVARPMGVIADLVATTRQEDTNLDLVLPPVVHGLAPWTAAVVALLVGALAFGLLRHLPSPDGREAGRRALIALGPGVLALGATSALLETEPSLLVAVLAWAGTLAVSAAMTVTVGHHKAALVASLLFVAYLLVAGLCLAFPSHLLIAALATLAAAALAGAYAGTRAELLKGALQPSMAALVVALAGLAATQWPYVAGGGAAEAGLSLAGVAAAALLLARPTARAPWSRLMIEGTAFVAGMVAIWLPEDATDAATALTIVGSALAAVAILNRDRGASAWLGVVLLGGATVIRVVEDVRAPEAYTLPVAVLLVAAGWWRLDRDPQIPSMGALSSGLTLGLAPSLLLALDDPVSLRGAVVAAAGLLVLTVGIVRLWAAPFLAGALTTGVLAVRHLGPVVEAVPRWISLGTAGLALLLVGVTWEARRRDLDAARRYVAVLR